MKFYKKPIEQPWAYAHQQGFKGYAPGTFFRYFRTKEEAEKSVSVMDRKGRWHGPIEYRPGESYELGYIF